MEVRSDKWSPNMEGQPVSHGSCSVQGSSLQKAGRTAEHVLQNEEFKGSRVKLVGNPRNPFKTPEELHKKFLAMKMAHLKQPHIQDRTYKVRPEGPKKRPQVPIYKFGSRVGEVLDPNWNPADGEDFSQWETVEWRREEELEETRKRLKKHSKIDIPQENQVAQDVGQPVEEGATDKSGDLLSVKDLETSNFWMTTPEELDAAVKTVEDSSPPSPIPSEEAEKPSVGQTDVAVSELRMSLANTNVSLEESHIFSQPGESPQVEQGKAAVSQMGDSENPTKSQPREIHRAGKQLLGQPEEPEIQDGNRNRAVLPGPKSPQATDICNESSSNSDGKTAVSQGDDGKNSIQSQPREIRRAGKQLLGQSEEPEIQDDGNGTQPLLSNTESSSNLGAGAADQKEHVHAASVPREGAIPREHVPQKEDNDSSKVSGAPKDPVVIVVGRSEDFGKKDQVDKTTPSSNTATASGTERSRGSSRAQAKVGEDEKRTVSRLGAPLGWTLTGVAAALAILALAGAGTTVGLKMKNVF